MGRRGVIPLTWPAAVARVSRRAALGAVMALATAAPVAAPATASTAASCGWSTYGHDIGRSFAQEGGCTTIAPGNVARLVPKWFVPTDDSATATPAVVDGVAYTGTWDGTFYAIDAETGEVLWTFLAEDTGPVAFGRIVASAAVDTVSVPGAGDVPVVLVAAGAILYALDPSDGSVLAREDVDPREPALRLAQAADPPQVEIESSPAVVHLPGNQTRIVVGMDVHNRAGVGRTGMLSFGLRRTEPGSPRPYRFDLLWKFDPETSTVRASHTDGSGTGFGCGGVWSSPAVDQQSLGTGDGIVTFGTSNCEHPEASAAAGEVGREGIFAIELKSGEELWRYHPRGPNSVDDDFGASPNLLPVGSGLDRLVGEGGKDGVYYALTVGGENGSPSLEWSSALGQPGHAGEHFAVGGIIGTTAVGEVDGEPAVFASTAISVPDESTGEDPGRMFSLHAISAVDGRVLWRSPLVRAAYGAPSYANGVVFVPATFEQAVKAFDADTGHLLWEAPTGGSPSSAAAIVGDSIYIGAGTRETDLEFKALGAHALQELAGAHPLSKLSGIWAFELQSIETGVIR